MKFTCPNPKSPEWIDLVEAVGINNAYRTYALNDERIPSVEYAQELLSNGVTVYPQEVDAIQTNTNTSHKIASERLSKVNDYLEMLNGDILVDTDTINVGGYIINIDTQSTTRDVLDSVIENERQRLTDEQEVLKAKVDSYIVNTRSQEYKDTYNNHSATDLNDNPIGITSTPTDLINYSPAHAWSTINRLTEVFAKVGIYIETIEDFTSPYAADIINLNGIPTIRINPNKLRNDTIYHEFGHALIDLIGYNDPFIQKGIEQVLNTPLATALRTMYPELSQERFEKELLTTAIGTEAAKFISNPESLGKWNFWLNRFIRKINDLLNKITNDSIGDSTDVAKQLASELVNGKIGRQLLNKVSDYSQQQREHVILKKTIDAGITFVNSLKQRLEGELSYYKGNTKFKTKAEELLARLNLSTIITERDLAELTETLGECLNYDLSRAQSLKARIQIYYAKLVDSDTTLDKMSIKERNDVTDALHNIRLFMASFTKIENIRVMTAEQVSTLTKLAEQATGEEKDNLLKTIDQMTSYMDTLDDTRIAIEEDRKFLKQQFDDLLPIVVQYSLGRYSSNPEVRADLAAAAIKLYEDEGFFAKNFDSLAKSTNPIGAVIAKTVQMQMSAKERKIRELQKEYSDARVALGNNFNVSAILDSNNRLVRKYDYSRFMNDLNDALGDLKRGDDGFNTAYYRFITANTKRALKEDGTPYTDTDINAIVQEGKKGRTKDEYEVWYNKRFKLDGLGVHQPRFTSEYVILKNYLNPKWDIVQNNANLKNYYDTVTKILIECADGHDIPQLAGVLPSVANEEFAKKLKEDKKDKIDDIEYLNAADEVQHLINFKNIGYLNSLPQISIPDQLKNEEDTDYEVRALARINNSGLTDGVTYDSLDVIKAENQRRRNLNVQRHGEAVNTNLDATIPMFIETSMDYKYKKEIESEIQLLLYHLKASPVTVRSNLTGELKRIASTDINGEKELFTKPGSDSRVYKHARDYVDMQLYGNMVDPMKFDKLLLGAKNYSSFLGIGFNVFASTKNITYGAFMVAAKVANGIYYNAEDMAFANKTYFGNISSYLGDANVFERKRITDPYKASSKPNAFFKQLPIIKSFNDLMERSTDPTINHRYFMNMISSAAFAGQEMGEHMMQHMTYLAMLHSHRLIEVDGKPKLISLFDYTNLKMKQTSTSNTNEINQSIIKDNAELRKSLKEEFESKPRAYDIFDYKDGYINVNEQYDVPGINDAIDEFKLRAIAVNHEIHGVYDKANRGTIEKTVLGQLLVQFKKWARPGWNERFGYRGGAFRIIPTWDESSQKQNVGSYKALGKYLFTNPITKETKELFAHPDAKNIALAMKNLVTDYAKFLTSSKVYWHMMTPVEQAAARQAAAEFATTGIVLALLIGGLKYRDKDDKNKKNAWLNFVIYQLDASVMELTTYVPGYGWINNGKQILANPTATWGVMNSVGKILGDLVQYPFQSPDQRLFQGGYNRDKSKLLVHVNRIIPFSNIYQRIQALQAGQYQAYKMVGNVSISDAGTSSGSN